MSNEKVSIQENIELTAKAIKAGVKEELIRWCLSNSGYSNERVETIIRWAKKG